MPEQNAKNHTRWSPLHHFFVYPAILALITGSSINLNKACETGDGMYSASLILLGSIILLILAFNARSFALKAQDRAIKVEVDLRYFAITGKLMDNKLTIKQVVALRFAPNNELMELAHEAVNKQLTPSQIKSAIKNWKADHHRV